MIVVDDGTPTSAEGAFRITLGDTAWMILVFGLLVGLFGVGTVLAIRSGIDPTRVARSQTYVIAATLVQSIVMVGVVYMLGLRRRRMSWRDMGFRPLTRRWIVATVTIAILCEPVVSAITAGFQLVLHRPITSPQVSILAPEGFSWSGAIGMLVVAGICAPFAEELFFRGVLYRVMRRWWSVAVAAIVSALIFGLVHGMLDVFPGTTVLGVVLALVYERSGSLWSPYLLHAVYNSISIIAMFALLAAGVHI